MSAPSFIGQPCVHDSGYHFGQDKWRGARCLIESMPRRSATRRSWGYLASCLRDYSKAALELVSLLQRFLESSELPGLVGVESGEVDTGGAHPCHGQNSEGLPPS